MDVRKKINHVTVYLDASLYNQTWILILNNYILVI